MIRDRAPLICAYENRPECEDGVRILVASLMRAMPHARMRLYHNPANDDFPSWVAQFPNIDWRPAELPSNQGWNVKPAVFLSAFDDGYEDVLWLDSDLLVTCDLHSVLAAAPDDAIIVAEEARWGARCDHDGLRTRSWNLPFGRSLPFTANSCFLRISRRHRELVDCWAEMLGSKEYLGAQAADYRRRPVHMMGDQDVLTALLGSTKFAHIPLHFLRRGRDILQVFGPLAFTMRERARVLVSGLPVVIHAQGTKPWNRQREVDQARWYSWLFEHYQDTSPYIMYVIRQMPEFQFKWLRATSVWGKFLRRVAFGRIALAGAPLAALFDAAYALPALRNRLITNRGLRAAPRIPVLTEAEA